MAEHSGWQKSWRRLLRRTVHRRSPQCSYCYNSRQKEKQPGQAVVEELRHVDSHSILAKDRLALDLDDVCNARLEDWAETRLDLRWVRVDDAQRRWNLVRFRLRGRCSLSWHSPRCQEDERKASH